MKFFAFVVYFCAFYVFSSNSELILDGEPELEVSVNGTVFQLSASSSDEDVIISTVTVDSDDSPLGDDPEGGSPAKDSVKGRRATLNRTERCFNLPRAPKQLTQQSDLQPFTRQRSPSWDPETPRSRHDFGVEVHRRHSDDNAVIPAPQKKKSKFSLTFFHTNRSKRFAEYRAAFTDQTSKLEGYDFNARKDYYESEFDKVKKITSKNALEEYMRQPNMKEIWKYFRMISKQSFNGAHLLDAIRNHPLDFLEAERTFLPVLEQARAEDNIAILEAFSQQNTALKHQVSYRDFLENILAPLFETTPLEVQQFFHDLAKAVAQAASHIEMELFNKEYTVYDFAITNFILYIINPLIETIHESLVEYSDHELAKYESKEKKRLQKAHESLDGLSEGVSSWMNSVKIDKIKATYTILDHSYEKDVNLLVLLQKSFSAPIAFMPNQKQLFFIYVYSMLFNNESEAGQEYRRIKASLQEKFFDKVKSSRK